MRRSVIRLRAQAPRMSFTLSKPSLRFRPSSSPSFVVAANDSDDLPEAYENDGPSTSNRISFRACNIQDIPSIALVCQDAFTSSSVFKNAFLGLSWFDPDLRKKVTQMLTVNMERKRRSTLEHREYRLKREALRSRSLLAQLTAHNDGELETVTPPPPETAQELRAVARWRRNRML